MKKISEISRVVFIVSLCVLTVFVIICAIYVNHNGESVVMWVNDVGYIIIGTVLISGLIGISN
jgi:amino acid transporter